MVRKYISICLINMGELTRICIYGFKIWLLFRAEELLRPSTQFSLAFLLLLYITFLCTGIPSIFFSAEDPGVSPMFKPEAFLSLKSRVFGSFHLCVCVLVCMLVCVIDLHHVSGVI